MSTLGRIFNLEFLFLNQKHKALISVNSDYQEPYIHIQLIDSFCKKFFSTEHIRYKGLNGYKNLEGYKDPLFRKLIDSIANEVVKELNGNYNKVKSLFDYFRYV